MMPVDPQSSDDHPMPACRLLSQPAMPGPEGSHRASEGSHRAEWALSLSDWNDSRHVSPDRSRAGTGHPYNVT
jgi:hypothetical protein